MPDIAESVYEFIKAKIDYNLTSLLYIPTVAQALNFNLKSLVNVFENITTFV